MAIVQGRPFLEHLLEYWIGQGVREFVLCIGHMAESVKEHFGGSFKCAAVRYSSETEPQGTGGALNLALSTYPQHGRFLVLNGDSFFNVPLIRLEQKMTDCCASWLTSLFASPNTERYGLIALDPDDSVVRQTRTVSSELDLTSGDMWVNGGVWLGDLTRFPLHISSLSLPYSLENYLEEFQQMQPGTVFGLRSSVTFVDIGVPADYASAQRLEFFRSEERSSGPSGSISLPPKVEI